MLSERQRNYRQEYRSRVDSWYNGPVHVLLIYVIGFTALWLYAQHLHSVRWWEWLSVPVFVLGCNIFEWYLHLKIMHRPQKSKALRAIYNRHTLQHHQFFTDSEMRFRDQKDWRVTFFPPYALVVFILISIPGAVLFYFLLTPNIGWLYISTTTSIYLIYEFMHFCCHVDENSFVRHMPLVHLIWIEGCWVIFSTATASVTSGRTFGASPSGRISRPPNLSRISKAQLLDRAPCPSILRSLSPSLRWWSAPCFYTLKYSTARCPLVWLVPASRCSW